MVSGTEVEPEWRYKMCSIDTQSALDGREWISLLNPLHALPRTKSAVIRTDNY